MTGGGPGTNQYAIKGTSTAAEAEAAQRASRFAGACATSTSSTGWTRTQPALERVKLDNWNMMAGSVVREFERGRYDMNPPYQRGDVWTTGQREALIQSMLQNIPFGAIIVSDPEGGQAEVVDGKQRLTTIIEFAAGRLRVPADWFPDEALDIDRIDDDGKVAVGDGLNDHGFSLWERCQVPMLKCDPSTGVEPCEPGTGNGGNQKQYRWFKRNTEETQREAARLFTLVNGGGTAQTDETMDRAARIARGDA